MWVWGFGNHKWYKSLVKSRVAVEWLDKRFLYHAWFPKPHTHISALTALALLKTTNKRYETTNLMRYLSERNESDETIFKHFGQCTHMCQVKVYVSSHMWVHWLKNCAITFNLHDKLFYSVTTILVFNNRGVYLCLIFEKSILEFITNMQKNQFWNKLDFLSSSNLIFTACVACKNQFRNQIDFLIF